MEVKLIPMNMLSLILETLQLPKSTRSIKEAYFYLGKPQSKDESEKYQPP